MNCEDLKKALLGSDQNALSTSNIAFEPAFANTIKIHLSQCEHCRNTYEQYNNLSHQFNLIPRPKASDALRQRILTDRVVQKATDKKFKTLYLGMAASVCIAVLTALIFVSGNPSDTIENPRIVAAQAPQSSVSAILNKPREVNFLVHSEQIIDNVTFTLTVPPQIVLYGYNGQSALSWNGKLKRGENLLTVPVMALSEQTGILVMKITHKNAIKEYRVAVNVRQDRVMAPIWTSGQLS